MRDEIVKGHEECSIGLYNECKGKECFAFMTFEDNKEGLCALDIGRAATIMIPDTIKTLSSILKKVFASFIILLFFAFSALPAQTIQYTGEFLSFKIDALTAEVKGLRSDLQKHTEESATQVTSISTQETKIESLCDNVDYLQENLKYLYGLLVLSLAGNTVAGGALWRQAKQIKSQIPPDC